MVKDLVGYRFSPTGEELINYYLKNKNLGKTWLVDEAISEINILSHVPSNSLPRLAKIQSEDLEWYFFSPVEYTNRKKNEMKRTTGSGFWKSTGVDRKVRDKRGKGVEIGFKKTLVYHQGKTPHGVKTPWVMHEYRITSLPLDKRNYVICQVKYKGEAGDISYGNNFTEPEPELPVEQQPGGERFFGMSVDDLLNPMNKQEDLSEWDGWFNPNTLLSNSIYSPYLQPHLAPNDDEFLGGLRHVDRRRVEYLFANEDSTSRPTLSMTENRNDHKPKKALSGVIDYSSDSNSDAESISTTSYQGGGSFEDVLPHQELFMQENRNDHRQKKHLTGIIVGYRSDSGSDAESISATSYQGGTSSPVDSVGSSNRFFSSFSSTNSCKDLQTSADPSIGRETREYQLTQRTRPLKQEVKQEIPIAVDASSLNMVNTEKKGLFILVDAMERDRKNPRCIYLINTIISFILLLALIGNIISVLLIVKS